MKMKVLTVLATNAILASTAQAEDAADTTSTAKARPNILFIMSDDHAAHGVGAYGSTISPTPNIDRIASAGMRFDRMFGVNSLCAPSRAILLTGKHTHANGMTSNHSTFDGSQTTFPKLLQATGYQTAIVGKWHLRSEPTGFDFFQIMKGQGQYVDCPILTKGEKKPVPHEGYLTDVITDLGIDWLERGRDVNRPFCLLVHHKAPHGPDIHKPEHAKLYADRVMPEPETLLDDWDSRLPLQTGRNSGTKLMNCDWRQYRALMASLPKDKKERTRRFYQTFIKGYLRLTASLDENVGRLLDYIDEAGLAENTIVVYTSDNGFFMGDHGMFNKMWMYEPSMRIPMLVRWPGTVEAGSVNDDLVCNLDFASTFVDIAGGKIPAEFQGRSFKPLLTGNTPSDWRESIYYRFHGGYEVAPHVGVRTATHKLIHFPGFKGTFKPYAELFDLRQTPLEMKNVHGEPAYQAVQEELTRRLKARAKATGDTASLE